MKTLIACYSFTGDTWTVCEELKNRIDADLVRIEPVKDRWYVIKAIQSYLEKKVPIKSVQSDLEEYDCLIIGCPVWASRTPSGVNQYLDELENTENKKFGVLVTMGGQGSQIATQQVKNILNSRDMEFIESLKITGNDKKNGNWKISLEEFANKFQ